ncbi:MAG: DNA polymerase III subunit delta [Vicinamibacterales bacterium]
MPALTLAALRKELAARTARALYLLVGDDEMEKAAVADEIAGLVEEGLAAFNVERLQGGEIKAPALIDAAAQLPMMADRRVVIVAEAEKLLMPKRESKAADADAERLEAFVGDAPAHCSVVFVSGRLDERRRIVKQLKEHAAVVDCGTVIDRESAERWVVTRAAKEGVVLGPGAARALAHRVGADIVALRSAFERVSLYALGTPQVTVEDVKVVVPAMAEEQEDFGIAKAIWRNDAAGALRELKLALDSGGVPFMLMGQLRAAAEKLPSARLPEAIDALMRTDLALKSSGGEAQTLLERLVVELCGAPAAGRRGPVVGSGYRR